MHRGQWRRRGRRAEGAGQRTALCWQQQGVNSLKLSLILLKAAVVTKKNQHMPTVMGPSGNGERGTAACCLLPALL